VIEFNLLKKALTRDKFRLAMKHPDLVTSYILKNRNYFSLPVQKTKHTVFLDFCKRILLDTISDEKLRERFFENPKKISELEMISSLKEPVAKKILVGSYWPERAHTMIGLKRLNHLQFCVEDIIKNKIEGDLIETGVWRGGATIFMRLILKEYEIHNKIVYVADSFEGLPKPDPKYSVDENDKHHTFEDLKVSLEEVKNNFKLYGVLDDNVKFLKGWFKDTLKDPPFEKLSILRLDGDMYGSTWDSLTNLYDKLSVGGYLVIDDYWLLGCYAAIKDFRKKNNINEKILRIDQFGAFWKKEK